MTSKLLRSLGNPSRPAVSATTRMAPTVWPNHQPESAPIANVVRSERDQTTKLLAICDLSTRSSPLSVRPASSLVPVLCLLLLLTNFSLVNGSGFFELQFLDGVRNSTTIHVCLKEFWNSQINFNRCTFGQKTIIYNEHQHPRQSSVRVPFSFRWIGSFSFTIQLSENSVHSGLNRFVVEDEFAVPGIDWKLRTFHAKDGRMVSIRFRVGCDLYYHSEDCATFCRTRNDTFGHYTCDKNGRKVCLDGWKGENCDKPKCRSGCNEVHGFCEAPNECTCRSGWKGSNCDQCVEYPGCLHGYCLSPFQCICHRNWGGILCDQDLNYCGTHEPCLNEGRCENIAPDNYRCICKKGFSGVNCQVVEDACATSPCLHSGTCFTLSNGTDFRCTCKDGFAGKRCERDLNECASQPCLNGGTCHDLENDFRCTCPSGWTGKRCEQDVDECSALVTPCIRASACINVNGSYVCVCEKGFEGTFCEIEVDDCQHNNVVCQNGGFCIDMVDDYRCVCATGFTGHNCDRIDQSVCELITNHVWRFNDTDCEKVCLCRENSKAVCTCQAEALFEETLCEWSGQNEHNQVEVRVTFDSPVSAHSCHLIYAMHSLANENNHFCCRLESTSELVIRVAHGNPLAQFINRTILPHMVQVMVNRERFEREDLFNLDYIITVVCVLALLALYCVVRARLKRRRQETDAQNVVIHCIQNNLLLHPKKSNQMRPLSVGQGKTMCNTLQYPSTAIDSLEQVKSKSISDENILSCKLFS